MNGHARAAFFIYSSIKARSGFLHSLRLFGKMKFTEHKVISHNTFVCLHQIVLKLFSLTN